MKDAFERSTREKIVLDYIENLCFKGHDELIDDYLIIKRHLANYQEKIDDYAKQLRKLLK